VTDLHDTVSKMCMSQSTFNRIIRRRPFTIYLYNYHCFCRLCVWKLSPRGSRNCSFNAFFQLSLPEDLCIRMYVYKSGLRHVKMPFRRHCNRLLRYVAKSYL